MSIAIIVRGKAPEVDRGSVRRLVERILKEHDRGGEDVTVVFADDEFVRGLNASYRGVDRTTDVLAFDMERCRSSRGVPPTDGRETILGDVVVSVDRARAQARRYKRTTERELLKLVAHGTLHLLGHDHEDPDDRAAMRRLENEYVRGAEGARRRTGGRTHGRS